MSRFSRGAPPSDGGNGNPGVEGQKESMSHGGYQAVRLYKERSLDLRRHDHKFLATWKQNLIDDLGGASEISCLQLTMIDQSLSLLIILGKMSEHIEKNGIMAGNELAPCLKNSYLAYSNSLRHCLHEAYEASKTKPKKPIDLKDYLQNFDKEEQTDGEEKNGEAEGRRHYDDSDGPQE